MLGPLKDRLLALAARDERVRAKLEADGSLFLGYHPRMEAVHRENAADLRAIMDEHGWPTEALVGPDGAQAAWLVLQYAISDPGFMRHCRALMDEASSSGPVPRWQFAYLDDRIRVFEGKAQRFGTQFILRPDGPELNLLEDPHRVDAWRRAVGLGPVSEVLVRARGLPLPSQEEDETRQSAAEHWRRQVGWATVSTMTPQLKSIDHIHVFVTDRAAAAVWYKDVLGLVPIPELEFWAKDGGPLTVSDVGGKVHVALFESSPATCRSTIALGVGASEFIAWKRHLGEQLQKEVPAEDHEVSWSLYFHDPDGNPYEITTYEHAAVARALRGQN